jgi:hypothetical protein
MFPSRVLNEPIARVERSEIRQPPKLCRPRASRVEDARKRVFAGGPLTPSLEFRGDDSL